MDEEQKKLTVEDLIYNKYDLKGKDDHLVLYEYKHESEQQTKTDNQKDKFTKEDLENLKVKINLALMSMPHTWDELVELYVLAPNEELKSCWLKLLENFFNETKPNEFNPKINEYVIPKIRKQFNNDFSNVVKYVESLKIEDLKKKKKPIDKTYLQGILKK